MGTFFILLAFVIVGIFIIGAIVVSIEGAIAFLGHKLMISTYFIELDPIFQHLIKQTFEFVLSILEPTNLLLLALIFSVDWSGQFNEIRNLIEDRLPSSKI